MLGRALTQTNPFTNDLYGFSVDYGNALPDHGFRAGRRFTEEDQLRQKLQFLINILNSIQSELSPQPEADKASILPFINS